MQFNAAVKSDSAGQLKGSYQCTVEPGGLHLARKKQTQLVIPRRTYAARTGSNQVAVQMGGRSIVLAINRFATYQSRLADAVAAYLRGERQLATAAEFKIEPYLLLPAVLPFGIMVLTRGGAIWGALGGIIAVVCLTVAQMEAMPRAARLGLIILINAALYWGIITMVNAAT
jgi:hypothetical protein